MNTVEEVLAGLKQFDIDQQAHGDNGLVAHLKGTYHILAHWKCSEDLCLAGLCHSVYGTESHRAQTVALTERSTLRTLIGDRAEYVAYLFGAHVKDTLWANLKRDQKELSRFSPLF